MASVEFDPEMFPQTRMGHQDGRQADAEIIEHPRANEGAFLLGYTEQQEALAALPPYEVDVVKRKSLNEPEITDKGTFYQEKVRFSDGAVRVMTLGMPNEAHFGADGVSPYPISGTDAWMTGESGINRDIIKSLTESGYYVVWLHHQGRHSERPTTPEKAARLAKFLFRKSVGRSASHQHALFDDFEDHMTQTFDTSTILSTGDSRGAMTGEAVDALAPEHDRSVGYSDYIDPCFAEPLRPQGISDVLLSGLSEQQAMGRLSIKLFKEALSQGSFDALFTKMGTFDPHPMNILHEMAWSIPLINGDAGKYAKAVPLNSIGVRTFMTDSRWSQADKWKAIHANRTGIQFLEAPGGHLNLADPEVQQARTERFVRLLEEMRRKDFSLPLVDYNFVIHGPEHQMHQAA